jgi:hypothetical protein
MLYAGGGASLPVVTAGVPGTVRPEVDSTEIATAMTASAMSAAATTKNPTTPPEGRRRFGTTTEGGAGAGAVICSR